MENQEKVFAELQDQINALTLKSHAHAMALTIAKATHAKFPQFNGYWDKFILVNVLCPVEGKAGTSFKFGDKVLWHDGTAYSVRTGMNTKLDADFVEIIQQDVVL